MTKEEFKQRLLDELCKGCTASQKKRIVDGVNREQSWLESFYRDGESYGFEEALKSAILNFEWYL